MGPLQSLCIREIARRSERSSDAVGSGLCRGERLLAEGVEAISSAGAP